MWGVTPVQQVKLGVYDDALQCLVSAKLTAGGVIAHFHHHRVLTLVERRFARYEMMLGFESGGTQMAGEPLANDVAIQRAKHAVDKHTSGPFTVVM